MRFLRSRGLLAAVAMTVVVAGCSRGVPREERQVVIIPDMEVQKKFRAQGETPLFEDGRMMRSPVLGTVARGTLKGDSTFYAGSNDGVFVTHNPVPVTQASMERGQERFNIYCAPCHDRAGSGKGLVVTRGALVPPPILWDQRVLDHSDGKLFNIISQGIRSMPGYKSQIPHEDRWAIVAYVRALQRAQTATLADVPATLRGEIR